MCNHRPLLAFILSVSCATPALAGKGDATAMRCGTDLLKVGETKVAAVQKCGEPMATDAFCKPVLPGTGGGCETVEEWTYNPGYGQFMTTLRFESGRLVSILYGDRAK